MIARARGSTPIASIPQWLYLALPVACALFLFASASPAAAGQPLAELAKPGRLLMLRHATAPGNGDPPGFRLDDCATQRNLDAEGRRQAADLGQRLARAGIVRARVYSSQWCRCLETARLLGLGPVEPLPALNSFYPRPEEREARLAALRDFLARLPIDGLPVVLVTHQFTITGFTSGPTASGSGSLFQLNGSGNPQWLGTLGDP
ncbi:MAG: histidine phosphatase family protein [Sulfuritalea sp.]|nr:histidine phosphatase family protein [Sulfuritalea sp.]